jgi:hypothetical protein
VDEVRLVEVPALNGHLRPIGHVLRSVHRVEKPAQPSEELRRQAYFTRENFDEPPLAHAGRAREVARLRPTVRPH